MLKIWQDSLNWWAIVNKWNELLPQKNCFITLKYYGCKRYILPYCQNGLALSMKINKLIEQI